MKQKKMKQLIDFHTIMKNYKQWVPNFLTIFRIFLTPVIIILGLFKQIPFVIAVASMAALTDCMDGFFARKWNAVSELGAQLDDVADKIFAISLCLCLTTTISILWIIVILEFILASCNLYFHYKSKKTESLWIGKIKTTILFIMIIIVLFYHFFPNLTNVVQGVIYVCINLQLLCILEYSFNFYDNMHPITVEDNTMHQKIMEEKEISLEEKTIELDNLKELVSKLEKNTVEKDAK